MPRPVGAFAALALLVVGTPLFLVGCEGPPGHEQAEGAADAEAGVLRVAEPSEPREEEEPFAGRIVTARPATPLPFEPLSGRMPALFLKDGAPPPPEEALRPVAAEQLTADQVSALLARLPDLPPEDARDFAFRAETLKPPRTGLDVQTPFPPPGPRREKPAAVKQAVAQKKAEPLTVVRRQPEGEVPMASKVSVTFSQPMVPLSTTGVVESGEVPVRISPSVAGEWRWLDTTTLEFHAEKAFPLATRYQLTTVRGARSALGKKLARGARWAFSTAPNRAMPQGPYGDQNELSPTLRVSFTQPIRKKDIPAVTTVQAGGQRYRVRLAPSMAEVEDPVPAGRGVQLVLDRPLQKNTRVSVRYGPGIPSVQGPLRSTTAESAELRTYPPFTVSGLRCTTWQCRWQPGIQLVVDLTNAVDPALFSPGLVEVTPAIPGLRVVANGANLLLGGEIAADTEYAVTISTGLSDVWKQKLSGKRRRAVAVGPGPAVTPPSPSLDPAGHRMLVLDPNAPRTYAVKAANTDAVRVSLYAVSPEDYGRYAEEFVAKRWHHSPGWRAAARVPGRPVSSEVRTLVDDRDPALSVEIDLAPALPSSGFGHVVVVVEVPGHDSVAHAAWIQATGLGVTALADLEDLLVWVSRLEDGAPVRGAAVTTDKGADASTDDTGLAHLDREGFAVTVRKGEDSALLLGEAWSRMGWDSSRQYRQLVWFVVDDRAVYRPGETARLRGWLRVNELKKRGDLQLPGDELGRLQVGVHDARGTELMKTVLDLGDLGGFSLDVPLPDTVNLGHVRVTFSVPSPPKDTLRVQHSHHFRVEEFRRPEFEVDLLPDGEYRFGDDVVVPVRARYYSGGPLPGAETEWRVTAAPTRFVPPNRSGFHFGQSSPTRQIPYAGRGGYGKGRGGFAPDEGLAFHDSGSSEANLRQHASVTGLDGVHRLAVILDGEAPPWPVQLGLTATVTDVNRQKWTTSSQVVVHPADVYLGLRPARRYALPGDDVAIDAVVSGLDGGAVAGHLVEVVVHRETYEHQRDRWERVLKDGQTCQLTSSDEVTRCVFKTTGAGTLQIRGLVRDAREAIVGVTDTEVWVAGSARGGPGENVQQQEVILLADQERYQAGDIAELVVQAPFAPAEGLLTVRRSGMIRHQRFSLPDKVTTLEVPIEDAHVPGVTLNVLVVGQARRVGAQGVDDTTLPPRPAYAGGSLALAVEPTSRRLEVKVTPRDPEVLPGASTVIDVEVRDADGGPASGAEVLVYAVDESVLALTGYKLPDPLALLYGPRGDAFVFEESRSDLQLASADGLLESSAAGLFGVADPSRRMKGMEASRFAPGPPAIGDQGLVTLSADSRGGGDVAPAAAPDQPAPKVAVRSEFGALLVFEAGRETDRSGRLEVPVTLPDNLTRYRLMAVAVQGARHFGSGEGRLVARKKLLVRPSFPRFMNYGDKLELPVVVQNQTDAPATVELALRGQNAALTDGAGRRVTLAPNGRAEVRFPAEPIRPGTARFQIVAAAGEDTDAAELALPVYTPATREAFAVYGTLDEGAVVQPVRAPEDVLPGFGGLQVSTSSTAVSALTDAFLYVVNYPYSCSEQISSRILSIVSLWDVLAAFEAEGIPDKASLDGFVARGLLELGRRQMHDGGFRWWSSTWAAHSEPYLTIHVTHALERAKRKGVAVDDGMRDRALGYLRSLDAHLDAYSAAHNVRYSPPMRRALKAYALAVRSLAGDDVATEVRSLVRSPGVEALGTETAAWLLQASARSRDDATTDTLVRYLQNRVDQTAAAAHFISSVREQDGYLLLHSERKTDGIALEALIDARPDDPLIAKVVRGLLAARTRGRWGNTQENAFILVALERYFSTYEEVTPDFVARVWLGDDYAGEQAYRGRTTERQQLEVPMAMVLAGDVDKELVLAKEGAGRLYYRLGMTYAPASLRMDAVDRGFMVERVYEAVRHEGDVRRDDDGTWHIKAGAPVRVTLHMRATSVRHHVALIDKLPAGFEPQSPALAGGDAADRTLAVKPKRGSSSSWSGWGWWFQHQNLRDERAEAFTTTLWPGQHTFSYFARATTPGRFVAPPAKAEEMYTPETFGRSAAEIVVVE